MGDLSEVNDNSFSFLLGYSNRTLCKYWYGLDLFYNELAENPDRDITDAYLLNNMGAEAFFRYNFNNSNDYCSNYFPFLKVGLNLNLSEDNLEQSNIGFGYKIGAGYNYGFCFSATCFDIELSANYISFGSIYQSGDFGQFNTINTELKLSVGL